MILWKIHARYDFFSFFLFFFPEVIRVEIVLIKVTKKKSDSMNRTTFVRKLKGKIKIYLK